jgi:RimJ/RimL family protein N-acetyltransferase
MRLDMFLTNLSGIRDMQQKFYYKFLKDDFLNQVRRVIAKFDSRNDAFYQLLERLGFRREENLIKNGYFWKD